MKKEQLRLKAKKMFSSFLAVMMIVFIGIPAAGLSNSYAASDLSGDYLIAVAGGSTLGVMVKGSSVKNKTIVQLANLENVNGQHMQIVKKGSWYYIKNRWSGRYLTVAKKGNGAKVYQRDYSGAKSQQWKFYSAGTNKYYIKNRWSGKYLMVNGSIAAGTKIVVNKKKNNAKFKWTLVHKSTKATKMPYTNVQFVSAMDSNKIIDLQGGMLEPGAKIQLYDNDTTKTSMKYRIRNTGDNEWYYIQNGCSNKYLEAKDGSSASGTVVTQWVGRGGEKMQKWRFIPCGDGYYFIQNGLGRYLTIGGHSATIRSVIKLEKGQNIAAQKWRVVNTNLGTNTYINCAKQFIADDRWKNGAPWGDRTPELEPSADWHGCAAYCYDWAKYMYGKSPRASGVTKYTSASEIRNGDIIRLKDSHGEHWFVVLSRNGNWLKTAEGNVDAKLNGKFVVRVSTSAYEIRDGKIYSSYDGYRTINEAFHLANHMRYDKK